MSSKAFKAWRKQMGFTQERSAREMGVTLRTVQLWESGDGRIPEHALRLMTAIAAGADHEPWGDDRGRK